jgi:hypothetical protein
LNLRNKGFDWTQNSKFDEDNFNRKTTEFKTKGKDNKSKENYELKTEKEEASLLKEEQ